MIAHAIKHWLRALDVLGKKKKNSIILHVCVCMSTCAPDSDIVYWYWLFKFYALDVINV